MTPIDLHVFARLNAGLDANGELASVSAPFQRFANRLAGAAPGERPAIWDVFLDCQPDPNKIVLALAQIDPSAPPPPPPPRVLTATLDDVANFIRDTSWPWPGWLAAGVLNALAADPGTGKTIMGADLARRLWYGLPWPDNQPNTLPAKTPTLWVPGDRHFVQLRDLADAYGLPRGAVLFNAPPHDPTIGLDLDDEAVLKDLEARILDYRPGIVFIDTVGMTTDKNLCKPEDAKGFFGPLMDLAARTAVVLVLLTHLSRDKQALGRRIVGACRVVWMLTHPDPDGDKDRRKVWVDKSYELKPPALGMTIAGDGCTFDLNPPEAPLTGGQGRPPVKTVKAVEFITSKLSQGDARQCDLIDEWLKAGESKAPIFQAFRLMEGDGRLVIDDSRKPKVCHLVSNSP
jgi:hypothetical protein